MADRCTGIPHWLDRSIDAADMADQDFASDRQTFRQHNAGRERPDPAR